MFSWTIFKYDLADADADTKYIGVLIYYIYNDILTSNQYIKSVSFLPAASFLYWFLEMFLVIFLFIL